MRGQDRAGPVGCEGREVSGSLIILIIKLSSAFGSCGLDKKQKLRYDLNVTDAGASNQSNDLSGQ